MNAGRALDALIAERVMGEAVVEHGEELFRNADDLWDSRPRPTVLRPSDRPNAPGGMRRLNLPAYSTDIAAAWEVVERLGARGYALHMAANRHENPPEGERCRVKFWSSDDLTPTAYADTAPLAICLAALEAAP